MQKSLRFKSGTAKYLQLKDILTDLIANEYSTGQRFLSERELMRMYNVSSLTVSQAMKSLTSKGIIKRKIGSGTFIRKSGTDILQITNRTVPFMLYVNIPPRTNIASINPLNWFITAEIRNGVINSFNGIVKMKDIAGIIEGLKTKDAGCILINPGLAQIEEIEKLTKKLVIIDFDSQLKPAPNSLRWERISGVYELIEYLVRVCGHRKIAMIAGTSGSHKSRIAAFKIACETFDVNYPSNYIKMSEHGTIEEGEKLMHELIAQGKDRPSAVFVDTDIKAMGAIKAAKSAGLKIPEDISIAGFDDIPDAASVDPPLTTVKIPIYEIGVLAAKKIMYPEKTDISNPLKTKLIIRKSTGNFNN